MRHGIELFVTDCTVASDAIDALKDRARVNLEDVLAATLYKNTKNDFLSLYTHPSVIDNIHIFDNFLTDVIDYVSSHPDTLFTLTGHVSQRLLKEFQEKATAKNVPFHIVRLHRRHDFLLDGTTFNTQGSLQEAIRNTGAPKENGQTQYWTEWLRRFIQAEAYPSLRFRDETLFYRFLKNLSLFTGKGINWAALARESDITIPTAQWWGEFLTKRGVLDFVEPVQGTKPRRTLKRPKLFWVSTSLALWLSKADMDDATLLKRYLENGLYLALCDRAKDASYSYFLDTNHYEAPIIETRDGVKTAYYLLLDSNECRRTLAYAKSLLIGRYIDKVSLIYNSGTALEAVNDTRVTLMRLEENL